MNCQRPLAPARDTAFELNPLSIITVNARSSGSPLERRTSRIIVQYRPERWNQRPTTSRRLEVKRSTKYFTCGFIATSYVGVLTETRYATDWRRADSANAYAHGSISGTD